MDNSFVERLWASVQWEEACEHASSGQPRPAKDWTRISASKANTRSMEVLI